MPCRSDHMKPTNAEIEVSKVPALLWEIKSGVLPDWFGKGSFPRVYNKNANKILEEKVPFLCEKLQEIDVSKYSLEMQMWWRDYQKADKRRIEKELQEQKEESDKQKALEKLTPYEKELLNL